MTGTPRFRRRGLIVVALALSLLTPEVASGAAVSKKEAVKAYAPIVYLFPFGSAHTEERHRPMDARTFVRESNLRWSHSALTGCDHPVAGRGPKPRLGSRSNPYTHQQGCDHDEGRFESTDFTRPRDPDSATRGSEGFFLDPDEDILDGTGTSAPVYYEFKAGDYITYWLFYPYSEPVSTAPGLFAHQGDWERITVKLNADNRATHVAYFAHNGACVQPYRTRGARFRGHPKVFAAVGSHASYATPGTHDTDVASDQGPRWRTYRKLRDVKKESFYGFGGAWGDVGNIRDTTGPLGPSRYKDPEPRSWSGPDC